MSRQELADRVNAYLFDHTGRLHELDDNYIGKLERGIIRWPQAAYREALRSVLGAATDRDLGFVNTRRLQSAPVVRLAAPQPGLADAHPPHPTTALEPMGGEPDVKRHEFLRAAFVGVGGLLASPSTLLDLLAPLRPTDAPKRVGRSEIEQVRGAADLLVSWGHSHGGAGVREAANAQLRWFGQLLNAQATPEVRVELHEAVGLLGHATAHMAFDACAYDDARQIFKFALACSEEVGSWHLRAKVLSSLARQEIWRGEPDLGLTYTELALVRSDRLTATEQAMLHTARARALAKLGRYQDTLRAVGQADEAFAHTAPAGDPPWMAYYDAAQHAGDTGHALFDLTVQGHRTEAADRLQAAVDGHTADYVRSRAMSQTKLASLTMAVGDPHEAARLGLAAVTDAGRLHSRRAAMDLAELRTYAGRHAGVPEVAELRHRLTTALAS
ncbi:XRE family transcriptional regulator [Jiangella aurantiaca]|uniref:XRE family transcriptional regulator n=2 Tax=Jiangella aurantiaca TaxID=2530373 RepID=A0A4R5AHE3_9ACTN|nr:XRE family transcriptional regulator [Jiangella aurantiaca]